MSILPVLSLKGRFFLILLMEKKPSCIHTMALFVYLAVSSTIS
ncbi:hypothetical protein C2W58_02185 [Bacillus pumilus]|nr:hypothetical protein C2W58_02185 [Bacillus pumilus]